MHLDNVEPSAFYQTKTGAARKMRPPADVMLTCDLWLYTTVARSLLGPGAPIQGVATMIAATTTINQTLSISGP
jgi:hypothetical protein